MSSAPLRRIASAAASWVIGASLKFRRRIAEYGAASRRSKPAAVGFATAVLLSLSPAGARAEPVTVAALGDSLTHGFGLAPQHAFPVQLEAWLQERGHDAVVINAGVSGDTTAGGLARLDWTLTPEVDAVIVELGGNDLLRGIDPGASRENLDAILTRLEAEGLPALLTGLPAPGNYGQDWAAEFNAMYPELAEKHGALLYPNFLEAIAPDFSIADRGQRQAAMGLMQSDGIHPNKDGVARIVEAIGPMVEDLIARAQAGAEEGG